MFIFLSLLILLLSLLSLRTGHWIELWCILLLSMIFYDLLRLMSLLLIILKLGHDKKKHFLSLLILLLSLLSLLLCTSIVFYELL